MFPSSPAPAKASSSSKHGTLFSPETLQSQLSTLEVLMAMWAGDAELSLSHEDEKAIEALVNYLALPLDAISRGDEECTRVKESLPAEICLGLSIDPSAGSLGAAAVEEEEEDRRRKAAARKLMLDVGLSLRRSGEQSKAELTEEALAWPRVRLRRSEWLTSAAFQRVCVGAGLDESGMGKEAAQDLAEQEDAPSVVLETVERISEAAAKVFAEEDEAEGTTPQAQNGRALPSSTNAKPSIEATHVYRSWSCLPSLSTKEKREDLVEYARRSEPPLTGFVLAGKPALVVLEYPLSSSVAQEEEKAAARTAISSYWSSVKRDSWADIQSSHKKVSETLVEECVSRVWSTMEEMTGREEVGGKEALRGTYKHRNDFRKVEAWLKEKGVEGRLKEALGADWN